MSHPTSIKGVLLIDRQVLLVKNSRDEWELPGGRIDEGEDHAQTLSREFAEELSIDVAIRQPIDSYLSRSFRGGTFLLSRMVACWSVSFDRQLAMSTPSIVSGRLSDSLSCATFRPATDAQSRSGRMPVKSSTNSRMVYSILTPLSMTRIQPQT